MEAHMATAQIEIPDEIFALLEQSPLAGRARADQVKLALAIYLFQEQIVSVGRAAEVAGEPRATFELLLGQMGIPPVRFTEADYEHDWLAIKEARDGHASRP
jgi:predicted HTH domain antitoxin